MEKNTQIKEKGNRKNGKSLKTERLVSRLNEKREEKWLRNLHFHQGKFQR